MDQKNKVLITGSSGFIGTLICPFLQSNGFHLKGFDMQSSENVGDFVEGKLENMTSLRNAVRGMDAVIHLAACSDDSNSLSELVPTNILGVYNIFEAARLEKVRRLILASSIQAVDWENQQGKFGVDDRSPTNFYGLLKVWAEDLGRMYSCLYGLEVIAARLGWVVRDKREFEMIKRFPRGRMIFLSYNDAKQFFLRCLLTREISFAILYALSKQQGAELFDMKPARQLISFEPQDVFPQGLTFPVEDDDDNISGNE